MRKVFITAFTIIALFCLVACTGSPPLWETAEIPERTPQLYVSVHMEDSPIQQLRVAQLSTDWDPNIGADGNLVGDGPWTGGFSASADHPLDFFLLDSNDSDRFIFYLNGADGKIELQFGDNFPPDSIFVRRWNAEFAVSVNGGGSDMALWSQYEFVEVTDNIIRIRNDGNDYIYEVDAIWPQGRSSFTFRIDSAR